jgi:hypothetical protein
MLPQSDPCAGNSSGVETRAVAEHACTRPTCGSTRVSTIAMKPFPPYPLKIKIPDTGRRKRCRACIYVCGSPLGCMHVCVFGLGVCNCFGGELWRDRPTVRCSVEVILYMSGMCMVLAIGRVGCARARTSWCGRSSSPRNLDFCKMHVGTPDKHNSKKAL